ncbi:hypothetical protein EDC36_11756 [Tepidimonas ignava]|uniref:Uncharacterized protein n=1 Tax=Tepidimonas ignava TaxID=114249 RepID=A0A4R3L6E1_9BURK|nr:hypothetical protein [Tepidimonas ignava]TCS94585.1 hypothetical protein EDC36_11756 [Tepidimonas ignava]TSE18775.1 hypothetical protein Tigna_02413 [Tepidimonas ignava]
MTFDEFLADDETLRDEWVNAARKGWDAGRRSAFAEAAWILKREALRLEEAAARYEKKEPDEASSIRARAWALTVCAHDLLERSKPQPELKPNRTVTYVCPVCAASLEEKEQQQ